MGITVQHGNISDVMLLAEQSGQADRAKRMHKEAIQFAMQQQAQANAVAMAERRMQFQQAAAEKQMEFRANVANVTEQNNLILEHKGHLCVSKDFHRN